MPDRFIEVTDVSRTLNGKKYEVPVTKILTGTDHDHTVSRDALAKPGSLDPFISLF